MAEEVKELDWTRYGVNHLEVPGCIINIQTKLMDKDGGAVTSIEILPDNGWLLEGYVANKVTRKIVTEEVMENGQDKIQSMG